MAMAYRSLGEKDQMNRAIAQYKKTSIDAKERSTAQRELKPMEERSDADEQAISGGQHSLK